jgi:hypothetical protein
VRQADLDGYALPAAHRRLADALGQQSAEPTLALGFADDESG